MSYISYFDYEIKCAKFILNQLFGRNGSTICYTDYENAKAYTDSCFYFRFINEVNPLGKCGKLVNGLYNLFNPDTKHGIEYMYTDTIGVVLGNSENKVCIDEKYYKLFSKDCLFTYDGKSLISVWLNDLCIGGIMKIRRDDLK